MKLRHVLVLLAILIFIVGCQPAEQPEKPGAEMPEEPETPAETPAEQPEAPQEPAEMPEAPETPAEGEEEASEETPEEKMEGGEEAKVGKYAATKETGVIRGVGCDYETDTVFFKIHNPADKEVELYKPVIPSQDFYLKMSLAGMTLTELDCGGKTSLEPDETIECSKSGINFRSKISELEDRLAAVMVGHHDALSFRCEAGNIQGKSTEASAADLGASKEIVGDVSVVEDSTETDGSTEDSMADSME